MRGKTLRYVKAKELYKGEEVKPCPFCGEPEEILFEEYDLGNNTIRWRVFCCNCIACIDPGYIQKPNQLYRLWNRRTGPLLTFDYIKENKLGGGYMAVCRSGKRYKASYSVEHECMFFCIPDSEKVIGYEAKTEILL